MRRPKLIELPLAPGALSDDTDLAAKLQATGMDKVRARGNRWETVKGWTAFNASGMTAGKARGAHQWSTLLGIPVLLAASESAVNAWIDGTRLDITPKWADVMLRNSSLGWGISAGPTITISCSWDVYDPATDETTFGAQHFLNVGQVVTFQGITGYTTLGSFTFDLNGTHTITAVTDTTFEFVVSGSADAAGNTGGSGTFVATVAFKPGLTTGTGDAISERSRIYSIDNFGENGVFCGSDGTPVFYWQPSTSYAELWPTLSSGSGWTVAGTSMSHSGAQSDYQITSIASDLVPGKTYELKFDITAFTFISAHLEFLMVLGPDESEVVLYPEITSNMSGAAVQSYSCRFVCPPELEWLIIRATNSLTLNNISVKLLSIAHTIEEAPLKNYALFVDGNRILSVLGSVEEDGDFNPLLWRWSGQDNYRVWITDGDNVAGELILGKGSYAVCGAQVGNGVLILSDECAYLGNFTDNGYGLTQIGQSCGAIGAQALSVLNNRAFWPSVHGFHAFDGAQVLSLQCPLKDRFVTRIAQYQENKTFSWINHEYGEVWYHYPHEDDGTEVSRYLIFNYLEQGNPWSFGTFDRTTMLRSGAFNHPIGIDTSGNVWLHETGTSMAGDITLPFVETGYATSDNGDRWIGCRRYYPDIKDQIGNIEFSITGKRSPQGQNTTQTIGPMTLVPDAPKLDFMIAARQLKFKWASSTSTTQWRLGIVGLELVTDRERQ
jgi:hypothetical protein